MTNITLVSENLPGIRKDVYKAKTLLEHAGCTVEVFDDYLKFLSYLEKSNSQVIVLFGRILQVSINGFIVDSFVKKLKELKHDHVILSVLYDEENDPRKLPGSKMYELARLGYLPDGEVGHINFEESLPILISRAAPDN